MAILLRYERKGYISARAARILLEYDDDLYIGLTSKLNKEIIDCFINKNDVQRYTLEEIEKIKGSKITNTNQLKFFYRTNPTAYVPEFPVGHIKTLDWIEKKAIVNPEKILRSREVYKKIATSMMAKETSRWMPNYKLAGSFFDNIIELAKFELDENIPF